MVGGPVAEEPKVHFSLFERRVCWSEIDARVNARQETPEGRDLEIRGGPTLNVDFLH